MEIKSRLEITQQNLQKEAFSTVLLSLNSRLSMKDAELVKKYESWKKF